jgi:hypothetical protein
LDAEFFERWIIPILLIRNEFNVAHAASAPLTPVQHQAILDFLDRAFVKVHLLLGSLVEKAQSHQLRLDPPSKSMDADRERLLKRIAEYASSP